MSHASRGRAGARSVPPHSRHYAIECMREHTHRLPAKLACIRQSCRPLQPSSKTERGSRDPAKGLPTSPAYSRGVPAVTAELRNLD